MLNQQEIEFIRRMIADKFHPDKIILFGSQARDDSDKHSDIDLLVLTNPNGNRRKLIVDIDRA